MDGQSPLLVRLDVITLLRRTGVDTGRSGRDCERRFSFIRGLSVNWNEQIGGELVWDSARVESNL